MRGIAIPWSKGNIFQKKPFILYLKKKTEKKQNPSLAGRPPIYIELGVVAPPSEHLVVDPQGILGVV
jgi:hypothetical protein